MKPTVLPAFARLPIKWIQSGEVAKFDSRIDGQAISRTEQNSSIAALRLFVSLCMIADYHSAQVKTTYLRLIALSGLSRPIVARALKRLVKKRLLEKIEKPIREGTALQMAGWGEPFYGKLPKVRLYDGSNSQLLV